MTTQRPWMNPELALEQRVELLLEVMTLEEPVRRLVAYQRVELAAG